MKMNYETSRLILKVLPSTAASQVLQFYLDNRNIFEEYEIDRPENFYTVEYQKALLHCEYNLAVKQSAVRFWVFEKGREGQIVGTVSFQHICWAPYLSCELGYKFDQRFWRRGYARESILKCIHIAFKEMKLHRMEAQVQPDNKASRKLLKELGFVREGIKRESVKLHGAWKDHEVYALLAEEKPDIQVEVFSGG